MIRLSETLALPADALTQTFGILARKGAGKTYAATKLAEEMLKAKGQIVAIDPVGNWWGLRLLANGQPSNLPVYIFGGSHADLPLDSAGAKDIAKLLANEPISAILDVSEMRKAERQRFAAAFGEEFFHLKKNRRTPVHLFLEEAQLFVPQQVMGDTASMVGAFEDIIRLGRNYGIGASMISQRPQAINKQVLSQAECLIVLQTNGVHERKAIEAWTSEHGVDRGLVGELPSLPVGTAYVWSPAWLRKFERVKIARKETWDGSSTPQVGAKIVEPKRLAPADLDALKSALSAAIDRAKASDPVALQRRIAELERSLKAQVAVAQVDPEAIRNAESEGFQRAFQFYESGLASVQEAIQKALSSWPKVAQRAPSPRVTTKVNAVQPPAPKRAPGNLPRPQQAILDALAWLEAIGLRQGKRTIVAFLADASPKSSAFMNNLGALRSSNFIDYPSTGYVRLTALGAAQAVEIDAPRTPESLHQMIYSKLPGPQSRILKALIAAYPESLSRSVLAELSGASDKSSAYMNNLGALRTLGLTDYPAQGEVAALPILFLEAQ